MNPQHRPVIECLLLVHRPLPAGRITLEVVGRNAQPDNAGYGAVEPGSRRLAVLDLVHHLDEAAAAIGDALTVRADLVEAESTGDRHEAGGGQSLAQSA